MLFNDAHNKVWVQDKVVDKVELNIGSWVCKCQFWPIFLTLSSLFILLQYGNYWFVGWDWEWGRLKFWQSELKSTCMSKLSIETGMTRIFNLIAILSFYGNLRLNLKPEIWFTLLERPAMMSHKLHPELIISVPNTHIKSIYKWLFINALCSFIFLCFRAGKKVRKDK